MRAGLERQGGGGGWKVASGDATRVARSLPEMSKTPALGLVSAGVNSE